MLRTSIKSEVRERNKYRMIFFMCGIKKTTTITLYSWIWRTEMGVKIPAIRQISPGGIMYSVATIVFKKRVLKQFLL